MAGTGKIRLVRYVAVAAAATALVGCSSSSKPAASTTTSSVPTTETIIVQQPTTTTLPPTPPTAAQIAVNRAYLKGPGAKLVTFETLTKPLVTPTTPSQFTCDNLERVVLPKLGTKGAVSALATKVSDPTLKNLFMRDIATKNLLLDACGQFGFKPAPEPMQYTRAQTASLFKRLAQFQIFP